jgi:methylthioribulose 1-phosphate dehydratase/enolase-phosphatase E1
MHDAPTGVQKERMLPTDMYVLAANGSVLKACAPKGAPHKPPKCSECGPLFLKVFPKKHLLHSLSLSLSLSLSNLCVLSSCSFFSHLNMLHRLQLVSGRIDKEVAVIKQQIVSSCLQDDAEE